MIEWVNNFIAKLSRTVSVYVGSSIAIALAFLAVLIWFAFGPFYHFSTDYQIIINTGTTIITFLLVFIIQNTQNRDSHALHLKLDELIRVNKEARNNMMDLDEMSDADIALLQEEFKRIACAREEQK